MSIPLQIRTDIAAKIVSLGTVIRGRRSFNSDELPALNVYMEPRTVEESSGDGTRYKIDGRVAIEYHKELADGVGADDQADTMIEALRTLIEVAPRSLDGLVITPGISFYSDEIEYPEDAGGIVSVRVVYSVPHIDRFG